MKKRVLRVVLFVLVATAASGQLNISADFSPPIKHGIILSGSFGEIRGTHFHTGLDIKPSNPTATDSILSCQSGYVSRIRTSRNGYGRSVYIDHPNGYTTVYAHLKGFSPKLDAYIKKLQEEHTSYELDIFPEPGLLNVNKGEGIGVLGTSGNSYGPHLHFEIRETATEIAQNPILFGIRPKDNKPPTISSIGVRVLDDQNRKIWRQSIVTQKKGGKYLDQEQAVPGQKIGLSIQCTDQMDGATNTNGIYRLEVMKDGVLMYRNTFNAISFDEYNKINAYIDFGLKQDAGRTEALCYKIPSNTISITDSIVGDGTFTLDSTANIDFVVTDFDGNKSIQHLHLIRYPEDFIPDGQEESPNVRVDEQKKMESGGFTAYFTPYTLIEDTYFDAEEIQVDKGNPVYRIGDSRSGLLKSLAIEFPLPEYAMKGDLSKMVFVSKFGNSKPVSYGTKIVDNLVSTAIGSFGHYQLMIDTLAPTIKPLKFSPQAKNMSTFEFSIQDNVRSVGSEKAFSYKVYLDKNFIPCELKELVNTLYVPIHNLSSGTHEISIELQDARNNKRVWTKTFTK